MYIWSFDYVTVCNRGFTSCFQSGKSMEMFGDEWKDHAEKIREIGVI